MSIKINDLIDLGDGVNRLVVSQVTYHDEEYYLVIDENLNKKLLKRKADLLLEVDINAIDINLFRRIISIMNMNLDFNYDKNGTLKK